MSTESKTRIKKVMGHLIPPEETTRRCVGCVHQNAAGDIEDLAPAARPCSGVCGGDEAPTMAGTEATARILKSLDGRKPAHGLDGFLFSDPEVYKADMDLIFHQEWLFAGHDVEIPNPGNWLTCQAGDHPIVVIRGNDGKIRAFHNTCRHRGFKICEGSHGETGGKSLVCQYHSWAYDIGDGHLLHAREMDEQDFDPDQHGLFPVHVERMSSYIFVCVAESPPDLSRLKEIIEKYSAPYNLQGTRVAYQSKIVENGNWKLVWENNRECYHCQRNHPELINSFPADWVQDGNEDVIPDADKLGLSSHFAGSEDYQYRIMRHAFIEGARAMTMDGQPAIQTGKRMGHGAGFPADADIGNVPFYQYPSTWNHWQADFAVSFRVNPLTPTTTEVVTTFLVPEKAVEGVDYDLEGLTKVWLNTNRQDQFLVERVQAGTASPAYRPGPYNKKHETGVIEFVDWYSSCMQSRLRQSA